MTAGSLNMNIKEHDTSIEFVILKLELLFVHLHTDPQIVQPKQRSPENYLTNEYEIVNCVLHMIYLNKWSLRLFKDPSHRS